MRLETIKYKLLLLLLWQPLSASAANDPLSTMGGLEEAAGQAPGLIRTNHPANIVVNIINVLLGLLSILFTVMIVIAGFKWMTSAGNAEKVKEAKDMLRNAVIGLAIVIASMAIANLLFRFVLPAAFLSATCDTCPVPPIFICCHYE